MASIKIHQNIFGFERKRKGFTKRQITGFVCGAVLAIGSFALFGYALGLPITITGTIAFVLLALPVICGFMPIAGMPAEEFATRVLAMNKRGDVLVSEAESLTAPIQQGVVSREQKKKDKRRGAECSDKRREDAKRKRK